ncbi:glycine zipper domain-containing protein [Phenylobacterium sp.]|uniref:glycine zipper domain-containing protein n=1 Tax=Phenylobacterium sp. TaxID=1871053 RepID=UPI002EDB5591
MPKLTIAVSALALAFAAPQAASAAGLGSLYSCDASGNANTTGAVVGGLVGALAGSQISKNERTLGAVIGAGIGSAIGNNIGCRMDRKSRQDAQMAFERALETGRAQNWSDASTGTTGRIEVLGPARGSSSYGGGGQVYSGRWRYAQGVAPATRVSSVGGMYSANGRINMRAAPNTSAAVIDRLQDGEEIEIGGAVAGGWLAVIEDGYVQGYVSRGVVRPAGGGGGECQLVRQTITERGQASFTERYTACRDSNGGWRLETA